MSTTDTYQIASLINDLQKKFIPLDEETLYMGIFGYLNEQFTSQMQNSNIQAIEEGNEAIPIRAKYEKNILTYAVQYAVQNINSVPPYMDVMVGFIESELLAQIDAQGTGTFTLDKNCSIMINNFEYHLDYDIFIKRERLPNGQFTYAARYNIDIPNPISDITNPYLQPPIVMNIDNAKFIMVTCRIRQVSLSTVQKKIISNNILENKSFDFEFDNQLASFEVTSTEGTDEVSLIPIFEGMPLKNTPDKYCYYTYIDSNHIRVKFERSSYEPKLNYEVSIKLQTTNGSSANFPYKSQFWITLQSAKIDYNGLSMMIIPISDSIEGRNRKSLDEIRQIIPKQILARDTIITDKDLENFFNSLSDFSDKIKLFKKRDNQMERLYYAYFLLKDQNTNILPTNTVNIQIKESDFENNIDARYSFSLKKMFKYDSDNDICIIDSDSLTNDQIYDEEMKSFLYSVPFNCVVTMNPLTVSYYLNDMNIDYYVRFPYINQNSEIQFITTSVNVKRISVQDDDYIISLGLQQNININSNLVTIDKNTGIITESLIKPFIYIDNDEESYYVEGNIVGYDATTYNYEVEFRLKTDSIINPNNRIRINNLKLSGTDSEKDTYAYLKQNTNMSIYIFAKFDEEYGRYSSDAIFGSTQNVGYTLCNTYDIAEPVSLFYNFSNIIQSKVIVDNVEETGEYIFTLKHIPVIRYSYVQDLSRYEYFLSYLRYRKIFIDQSLNILENSFGVDFKFFNTYGPSKLFTIGRNSSQVPFDRTNISLEFDLKLSSVADMNVPAYIKESIKEYIENINSDITRLHITNLTTYIEDLYKNDIEYIEFIKINNYNALYQYIEEQDSDDVETVPEFLNINLIKDTDPDIVLNIV